MWGASPSPPPVLKPPPITGLPRALQVLPLIKEQEAACPSGAPTGLLREPRHFSEGVALLDTRGDGWTILFANDAWVAALGASSSGGGGRLGCSEGSAAAASPATQGAFWDLFSAGGEWRDGKGGSSRHPSSARQGAEEAVRQGEPISIEVEHGPARLRLRVTLRPAATDQLQTNVAVGKRLMCRGPLLHMGASGWRPARCWLTGGSPGMGVLVRFAASAVALTAPPLSSACKP